MLGPRVLGPRSVVEVSEWVGGGRLQLVVQVAWLLRRAQHPRTIAHTAIVVWVVHTSEFASDLSQI